MFDLRTGHTVACAGCPALTCRHRPALTQIAHQHATVQAVVLEDKDKVSLMSLHTFRLMFRFSSARCDILFVLAVFFFF